MRPVPVERGFDKRKDRQINFTLLLRQMSKYLPGVIGPGILGVLSSVLFTRLLTTGEYGQFTLINAGAALGAALCSQWLQQAIGRYLPQDHVGDSSAHRGAIALALIMIAAIVISGTAVVTLFGSTVAHIGVVSAASSGLLVLTTAFFGTLTTVLQSDLAAGRYTSYQLIHASLRFALAVVGILFVSATTGSIIWAYALAPMFLVPSLWRHALLPPVSEVYKARRRLLPSVLHFGRYGLPMVGWFLSANLLNVGDRYIIQWFRGSAEVGVYAANYSLVTGAIGLVVAPVYLAAHPLLMRAWERGEVGEATRLLGQIMTGLIVLGAVSVGVLTLFSADIATLLLGLKFRAGHGVMPVVLGGLILWQLGMYAHKPLEFTGQTKRMLWYSLIAATTNLLLNLALVPFFGYAVAASTTAVSYALYTVLCMRAGRQVLRWNFAWKQIIGLVAASAAGFAFAAYVRDVLTRLTGSSVGLVFEAVVVLLICAGLCVQTLRPFLRWNSSRTSD